MYYQHLILFLFCVPNITTADECNIGWIFHENSCYFFGSEHKSWPYASSTCAALDATLAIINSTDEDKFLRDIVMSIGRRRSDKAVGLYFWIDGTDYVNEGHWIWSSTNQPITYKNFYPGEPDDQEGNEDCLEMNHNYNGQWNDKNCYDEAMYICEQLSASKING